MLWSQKGPQIIPENATAVVTIKGKNLTDLLSIDEIENSKIGKEMIKALSKETDGKINSLYESGIDFKSNVYYFFQASDSISFHGVVLPLQDKDKMKLLLDVKESNVKKQGSYSIYQEDGRSSLFAFNNDTAIILKGDINYSFFYDEDAANRYGIEESGSLYELDELEELRDLEEFEIEIAPPPAAVEEIEEVEIEEIEETVVEIPIEEEEVIVDREGLSSEGYNNKSYNNRWEENNEKKKALAAEWTFMKIIGIITGDEGSVNRKSSFLAAQDKNAEATFWMDDLNNIYGAYSALGMPSDLNFSGLYEDTRLSANLHIENDRIEMQMTQNVNKDLAQLYAKTMNAKPNKKFYNYLNENKMLGYMSYAINTEAFLYEYPKLLKKMFAEVMPEYEAEASIGADLFSLLLDEEAVANLVKGDMMFVVTDVVEKERSYKTYTYDEDFNRVEVTKTKKEPLPEFLLMASTGDEKMMKKLMSYLESKKAVKYLNGMYNIAVDDLPLELNIMMHNGIVFMGTSKSDLINIKKGSFKGNLGSKHKKLISANNMVMYVNGKRIMEVIPAKEFGSKAEKPLSYLRENLRDMTMTSGKPKGNKMTSNMIINIPENSENGLKYLFEMMNQIGD